MSQSPMAGRISGRRSLAQNNASSPTDSTKIHSIAIEFEPRTGADRPRQSFGRAKATWAFRGLQHRKYHNVQPPTATHLCHAFLLACACSIALFSAEICVLEIHFYPDLDPFEI